MTTWAYRVMRRRVENSTYGRYEVGIYEVYFANDDDDTITSWTDSPIDTSCESLHDLKETLLLMSEATMLPVLDYETANSIDPMVK